MPCPTRLVCLPTPDRLDPLVARVRRDLTPEDITRALAELAEDVRRVTVQRAAVDVPRS